MKKIALLFLTAASLLTTGCALFPYSPKVGSSEASFLRNTISYDLVYLEGTVKAYRVNGSYYYFKDRRLVSVGPTLIPADKI